MWVSPPPLPEPSCSKGPSLWPLCVQEVSPFATGALTHSNLTWKGPCAAAPSQALTSQRQEGGGWEVVVWALRLGQACLLGGHGVSLDLERRSRGRRWHHRAECYWGWLPGS